MRPIRQNITLLVLATIASCLLAPSSRAADRNATIDETVDRTFRPLMAEYDVPGMAIAVTAGGRSFFFSYGVASKESGAPVTKDTLFEIGSLSKTFTATFAGYAQASGTIALDDHPGKHMPSLRDTAVDKATLLNLGTFTAGGLPLQFPDAVTDDAAMIAFFRQWKADAAPGVQRRYSNPSIGLFGHVAAAAMRGDFASLMESELFPKLGLKRSYIRVPKAENDRYAWGYNKAGKPIHVNPGVFDAEAYGVKSNAVDMIRFVDANIRPETLDAPLRSAVEGTHVGYYEVGAMVQGLGWEQYPYPATLDRLLAGNADTMALEPQAAKPLDPPRAPAQPTLFNKTGSTNGFGAYAAFVPAKKIGIVMLANKNFPIRARVTAAYAVLERLAAEAP